MGKTFTRGKTENLGNINLLTPQQSSYLSSALGAQQRNLAGNAYSNFLQPYEPEQFQDLFQTSFVDPATQVLQRQIIPAIKESFLGLDESGSGSLNRALAQSATDLSTALGTQYMNFYNQNQSNQLNALGQLGNLGTARTFQPLIQQTAPILPSLLQSLGSIGGAALQGWLGGK